MADKVKIHIVLNSCGVEALAAGKPLDFCFTAASAQMLPYFLKEGAIDLGEISVKLPSREEAIAGALPILDKEIADLRAEAQRKINLVENRKADVLALPQPHKATSDDIPF